MPRMTRTEARSRLKFPLGRLLITPAAQDALLAAECAPVQFVARHVTGDWGDVCPEDAQLNDRALADGSRLLSSYALPGGGKLWIITEADRSSTTLLLPEDY